MATIAEQLTSLANTKTAIKDAIVAKGVAIADTDPFSAYATKIGEISGGGAPETLYGATIGMVLGHELVGDLSFDGVTDASLYRFYGKFANESGVTFRSAPVTVSFPDLETVSSAGLAYMFFIAAYSGAYEGYEGNVTFLFPKLKSIDALGLQYFMGGVTAGCGNLVSSLQMPLLESITGSSACDSAFYANSSQRCLLTEVEFPSLTTIDGSRACEDMFHNQTALQTVAFPVLATINGSNACSKMLSGCTSLTTISFPALTSIASGAFGSSSMAYIFYGCTALAEIHFRADMRATIEATKGYANKWGAPETCTIYFDL